MRPHYFAVAAVSLDGRIARYIGEPSNWTSREDKKFLHSILDTCDVIVVGSTTYRIARKPLSKRNCIVCTRVVPRVIQKSARLAYLNLDKVDIENYIADQKYRKVCILGGSQIYSYFFERDLVDEFFLTIEPVAFGKGVGLFCKDIKANKIRLVSVRRLNRKGALLLHYKC